MQPTAAVTTEQPQPWAVFRAALALRGLTVSAFARQHRVSHSFVRMVVIDAEISTAKAKRLRKAIENFTKASGVAA